MQLKLASLTFLVILLVAHLFAGDPDEGLGLPLSMFRDDIYRPFGYLLFALLLVIAGQMLRTLHRAGRAGHACLLGVVALFLLVVAVTPSANGFHLLCSFVVLALLFGYYAAVLHRCGAVWLWAHLAVPLLLVLATRCHSYGLWQKSLIVYFLLAVNVQHSLLSAGQAPLRTAGQSRRGPRGRGDRGGLRQRVAYRVEPDQSWSRRKSAGARAGKPVSAA
jgi:hypothetical protein